ncbi:MAG: HEPN domain-containing protein [Thaumarchaeota archaeon]|nr:HEPN domain-containing protein [Nitrososphaerota archaeon]
MVRSADPSKAPNYVIKAEEFLRTANASLENNLYNSAVANAVHCGISALDALTCSFKGKRGSDDHNEVLFLVQGILSPREYDDIRKQFTNLIDKKNASEYQPDLMGVDDAKNSILWAERILARAKTKLTQ